MDKAKQVINYAATSDRCLRNGILPDEWSNDACRGYVIMAMEDCGFSKKDIRRVVGQLYEVFDLNSVEDAKEKYHSSPY